MLQLPLLQLQWESQRPFSFNWQFRLLTRCISWSFFALYHVLFYLTTCSCMSLYLLVSPGFSEKCECTYLPTLSCLHLYSFWASLPHSLNIWNSLIFCTTHPTMGWLVSFVKIALDMVSSYRLFLGTMYQGLVASF